MDQNDEIQLQIFDLIRVYKSGRVERLEGTDVAPASVDPHSGVSSKDIVISPDTGVSARLYLPSRVGNPQKNLPVLIYFHGGGFCVQTAFSPLYHPFLNTLAARANIMIVSVDYRLAPEHPLPAAYDDARLALKWVASHAKGGPESWLADHADFEHVFLAGDSAGANISHHMAMRNGVLGPEKEVMTQIERIALIHPFFWGTRPIGSESTDAELRMKMEELWRFGCPSTTGTDDPLLNPLADDAPGLEALRCDRVLVCAARMDPMIERGRAYYDRLKKSGFKGEVEMLEAEGEEHVFHLYKPESEKALEIMEKLVSFFKV